MSGVGGALADALDEREGKIDVLIERYVPYVGLAIGTFLSPLLPSHIVSPTVQYWLLTGSLVALAAGWAYWFTTRLPCSGPVSKRNGAIYMVGNVLLMAVLTYLSPFYAFQALSGYLHAFTYLHGRWRWLGIFAVASIVAYSQTGGSFTPMTPGRVLGIIGITAVNAAVGGGFTYFGMQTAQRSQHRREVIVELNETNRRLSETLDENAALHAQLLVQAREAGVLDERARMAREIHDTIAQGLTGIVTQLEAAGAAEDQPDLRRRHVDTAAGLARESLREARRSVDALAPGQLVEAQLPDAIRDLAKDWAETAGVEVTVDTTGEPRPLLPELEVALFRVAQEALVNIGKHAEATRAGLTLSYMDDVVVLDVRDDGRGFDPGSVPEPSAGSGFGLAAMEQRVRRVSGTVTVESAPGEGAALSVTVPAIPAEVRR